MRPKRPEGMREGMRGSMKRVGMEIGFLGAVLIAGVAAAEEPGWLPGFREAQETEGAAFVSADKLAEQVESWSSDSRAFGQALRGREIVLPTSMEEIEPIVTCCMNSELCRKELAEVDEFFRETFSELETNRRAFVLGAAEQEQRRNGLSGTDNARGSGSAASSRYYQMQQALVDRLADGVTRLQELEKQHCEGQAAGPGGAAFLASIRRRFLDN